MRALADTVRSVPAGVTLLEDPIRNRGTAFTADERARLGLNGLLPHQIETIDEQLVRAYEAYLEKPTPSAGTSSCAPCRTRTRSSSTGSSSRTSRR